MNWEAIGAIGELLGALGVIATLIYLSIQIRQNNKLVSENIKLASNQTEQDHFRDTMEFTKLAIGDPDFIEILETGNADFDSLSRPDKVRYTIWYDLIMQMNQMNFYQHERGYLSDEMWNLKVQNMYTLWSSPRFQMLWRDLRHQFTPTYQEFVDARLAKTGRDA